MAETTKQALLIPREATTFDAIAKLSHDNVMVGDFAVIMDEKTITLDEQKMGHDRTQKITLPRWVFERFVDWYERGIVPPEDGPR